MRITVTIDRTVETPALIDSGAGGTFIDEAFAHTNHIALTPLITPLPVYNVDGTLNKLGKITHYTWRDISIAGITRRTRLLATSLGKETIILGLPWLRRTNAQINWQSGEVTLPDPVETTPPKRPQATVEDDPEEHKESPTPRAQVYAAIMSDFLPEIPIEQHEAPPTIPDDELEPDDLLIAYIHGQPVVGIFNDTHEGPLTPEHRTTDEGPELTRIGRIAPWRHSKRFSYEQRCWTLARVNPAMEMAQKQYAEQGPKTTESTIPSDYQDYQDVFEKKASERFPESRPYDHAIDLKPDFVPKSCKVYPLPLKQQALMDEFIDENLRKGYIRPSKSPMASPFFFVAKKDGSLRPCQDYRYLNDGTIKNAYPIPLVQELVDKLKGATVFSKFDLRSGYTNVRIKEGDQWKAAFKCSRGLFEPTVMFFGMCNSPATFQAMMDHLFEDMIEEGWLVIYMDDMLLFSKDLKTHQERTRRILQRLRENDLYLKPEKCVFDVSQVEFLGLIVQPDTLAMDPVKLQGIKDWPTPTSVKGVRSFLGFANFYRRFISGYSNLTRPLHDLTKKDRTWSWTEVEQEAFDALKHKFISSPVLLMPDKTKPFSVESDASKFASGAVLRQTDTNGDIHPCAYLSKSFNAAERNYEIYDRELLGIIRALDEWCHYLEGSPHPVEVLSDHKNLTYFRTAQKLNRRQARWSLRLSQFNLQLKHVPGTQMVQSDTLSRLQNLNLEDNDNDAIVLLPDNLFIAAMDPDLEDDDNDPVVLLPDNLFIAAMDTTLADRIRAVQAKDQVVMDALAAAKDGTVLPMKSTLEDWSFEDGLVFFQSRCYVPPDQDLRREVVRRYHDLRPMGHPGQFGTLELLRREYWWPGMSVFVRNYVQGCAACQQSKPNTHPTSPPLMPIPAKANARPFETTTIDFITDLPPSNGFDSIMVMADHDATKGVILSPCSKTIDALETTRLIHRDLYKRFGLPSRIISDRGPQFASKVFQELTKLLGVKSSLSTAYHPQTDGGTERMNQEIEAYLRAFCGNNATTWADYLPDIEFTHNQRLAQNRNASPFFLMMGYNPRAIPTVVPKTTVPAVEERLENLEKARQEAMAAHELARQRMAERITRGFTPFTKGQKVWLEAKNLRFLKDHKKLAMKRQGPFEIIEVLGPLTYKLKLPSQWQIHDVFHAALLTPYRENDTHGPNFELPPPDLIAGEEEYEVEAIVGHRKRYGKMQFFVKWKGYPTSENSWEPVTNLENADELLSAYKKLHRL